ncbi:MAG: hypothetical protein ACYC1U_05700 [Candidatus Aquicultorales bacterium]
MDKNEILLSHAREAYIAEAYAANTVIELARECRDADLLDFLATSRDAILRKQDKMATVLRRHGGDVPEAFQTSLTMIPRPINPLAVEEFGLYATMSLFTFAHMMMGSYMGLVNIAKLYPNEYSSGLLSENLMDTMQIVESAYARLPQEVQEALGQPMTEAA